ncbi:hypothetical protein CONPUDRAFT_168759 [Coniophora puteana RWD-64-598 SS2]|uniref:Uncharacterized protein n=1 Tax=Coniophora puteana (strain RWD-64-598) TaxID=741705 RepID=A0A5M3MA95_CONPW|nr:uncharacterized protein CONPUDRAFT_168759 [Coniophora puteana RWD-64-598 SS2]EIW76178.1 hypothetical protein CONPUDRAFT_168759 [Coniophora puteana RWD-64-598 SS2]
MALNWTMLDASRSPVPLPHEHTVTSITSGVQLTLQLPASRSNDTPIPAKTLKETGKVWLTDMRLIFASMPDAKSPAVESLSIPLPSILSSKFEQPTFGANYLELEIKPSEGGGLTSGTTARIAFQDSGLFEFVAVLGKTRERAIYMKRQEAESAEDEGLPTYSSTGEGTSDMPPGYEA